MSRILIIDDDRFVRTSIRAVLESAGYEIQDTGDADTGIAAQKEQPFDLAIIDLIMPQKEGLETIRELKAEFPELPIIAISGGGEIVRKNFIEAAQLFGAGATLEKPFGGEELLSTIEALLSPTNGSTNAA